MLTRTLAILVLAFGLPLAVAPVAIADDDSSCPPGTNPVSVRGGVVCVVVTEPGDPGNPGDPSVPGDEGQHGRPVGCHKSDGTEVPCQTSDGYWWSSYQCYAAPFDAPPGSPAWQGHTDGSLWQCTSCRVTGTSTMCNVQTIWTAPGQEPGPPTPRELATVALGQLPLATAQVRTAPRPPADTYIGVENWLWIPESQWETLRKSVTAATTTVTVTAAPVDVSWDLGPGTTTCHGPGQAWVRGMTDAASTNCSYAFTESSAEESSGSFAIAATIRYHVTWTCSGTCPTAGGDLGVVDAPVGTGAITVRQRQTVVVQ